MLYSPIAKIDILVYSLLYIKPCVKPSLSKRPKIGFQDQLSLNAGQQYCRIAPREHSAVLLTFIKLPFVVKIFVLNFFEWPFYTGFTAVSFIQYAFCFIQYAFCFINMLFLRYDRCFKISNISFCRPQRPRQTVQTQIRLLLKQSDQGLLCLLF